MRRFVVTLGALVTATAVLVGPSAPSGAVATRPSGLHSPAHGLHAAPPDAAGRYAVGLSTVRMVDPARADRTLTVDIWYPADKRLRCPHRVAGPRPRPAPAPRRACQSRGGPGFVPPRRLLSRQRGRPVPVLVPDAGPRQPWLRGRGARSRREHRPRRHRRHVRPGRGRGGQPPARRLVRHRPDARPRPGPGGCAPPAHRRAGHRRRRPFVRRVHGVGDGRWVRRLPARPARRRHRARSRRRRSGSPTSSWPRSTFPRC